MSTFRMWEVFDKAQTGPFCKDQNTYTITRFIPEMKRVIKKYNIVWDKKSAVNMDDTMADAVWNAAKEFFISVGVYNQDTHRVMEFTEEEVDEILGTCQPRYMVGAGHDQRAIGARKVEDKETRPFFLFSPDMSYSSDIHKKACMAYLKEPLIDGLCAPLLEDFMGVKIRSNSPSEVAGAMEHAMNLRDAMRLVGKPDIYSVSVGTAESDQAQIAAANKEWGVRPSHYDGRMVSILTELTTNDAMLNKSFHYRAYGNVFGNLCGAIYGGYAGGVEATAILQTVYNIQGACLYGAQWSLCFPFHMKWQTNTGKEMLWILSANSQAVARNSNLIFLESLFANAGPGTDLVYYEAAAHALTVETSGANIWGAGTCRNKFCDMATPLESRMFHETALASFKNRMTREEANDIALKLLEKYEKHIPEDHYGYKIQEVYDMDKVTVRPEFTAQYKKIKEELKALGVKYAY
ncbi:MAG: monomethylamine:corrinoid methyltransferase [Cloacibacillus sp.]